MGLRAAFGEIDHVTGLPTRAQFVRHHAAHYHVGGELVLITLADARQFNEILRALGHDCADAFVRAGVARIAETLGPEMRLYHVSVLSIAFCVPRRRGVSVLRLMQEVILAFATPLNAQGIGIRTRIGIGLTDFPPTACPTESLRAALSAAQDSRRRSEGFARYDRQSDEAHRRAFRLLRDLEGALKAPGQLELHYQPRLDLDSNRCHSAEALIRWTHPELGAVSPGEFIPLAEATALIAPLTEWVVRAALRQCRLWMDDGLTLNLSINVSPHNLHEPGFLPHLQAQVAENRLQPGQIEIEFTEGALVSHEGHIRQRMLELRALDIPIAIDDFGTGYSSLSYLMDLPATTVKLDRSFLRDLMGETRTQLLVRSVVEIAHNLGLRIVAEGVENQEQLVQLRDYGYDEVQGYLISRPLRPELLRRWFAHRAGHALAREV